MYLKAQEKYVPLQLEIKKMLWFLTSKVLKELYSSVTSSEVTSSWLSKRQLQRYPVSGLGNLQCYS